jgi:anti-sigma regulatory factor (Ser/Thr protein kinase)
MTMMSSEGEIGWARGSSPGSLGVDGRLWQAICHAAGHIVQETDLNAALEAIIASVRQCLDLDRVGIFLYDRCAGELRRIVGIDARGEMEYEATEPIRVEATGGGPLQQVARGEISYFYSPDVRVDLPHIRFLEPIRAHAAVPLVAGSRIQGVLCVDNLLTGRPIVEAVLEPLSLFGHFAAIAIQNALRLAELAQAEEQKREFYYNLMFAVTNGKLMLCERGQIDQLGGEPLGAVEVSADTDVRRVRDLIQQVGSEFGMDEQRIYDLGLCASEGATNAIKHGGGGWVALTESNGHLRVRIQDTGAGMDPLSLPCATLLKGYSTKASMGLGFTIMHELTDRLYLHTGSAGTIVVLEMAVKPSEEPALPAVLQIWEE